MEELAARADVSVDTVRFYQSKGLLPGPRRVGRVAHYGDDHLERLRQIRTMQQRGFSLALIGRTLAGELDRADQALAQAVLADADDAPAGHPEQFVTLAELAAKAGVPVALLQALEQEGVLIPRRFEGQNRYTDADLRALGAGLALLDKGVPLSEVLDLARRFHEASVEVAERAVALFDDHVRGPLRASGEDDAETAARLVEAFRELLPATVTVVAHHFRRVLLATAQAHIESVGDGVERAAVAEAARQPIEGGVAAWE